MGLRSHGNDFDGLWYLPTVVITPGHNVKIKIKKNTFSYIPTYIGKRKCFIAQDKNKFIT